MVSSTTYVLKMWTDFFVWKLKKTYISIAASESCVMIQIFKRCLPVTFPGNDFTFPLTPWRGQALMRHAEVRRCNRTPPLHHLLHNRTYLSVLNCQWPPSAVWVTEIVPTVALDTTDTLSVRKCRILSCIRVHLKACLCRDADRFGFFWKACSNSRSLQSSAQGSWNVVCLAELAALLCVLLTCALLFYRKSTRNSRETWSLHWSTSQGEIEQYVVYFFYLCTDKL